MKQVKLAFIFSAPFRNPYLEFLLFKEIKNLSIRFCMEYLPAEKEFILRVLGGENEVKILSDVLATTFPLSLFFVFKQIQILDDDAIFEPYQTLDFPHFTLEKQRLLPAMNIDIKMHLNELQEFPYKGNVYLENVPILSSARQPNKGVVAESFYALAKKVALGEEVYIHTLYGAKVLSINESEKEWSMPCDIATLELFFRVCSAEVNALASWEKPLMRIPRKGLKQHQEPQPPSLISPICVSFDDDIVCLPYDVTLLILAHFLIELKVDIVYLSSVQKMPIDEMLSKYSHAFVSNQLISLEPLWIAVSQKGHILNLSKPCMSMSYPHYLSEFLKQNPNLPSSLMVAHMGYEVPTIVAVCNEQRLQKILEIYFPLENSLWLQEIQCDSVGAKLIANFIQKFPHIQTMLAENRQPTYSENLFDVLGVIYQVLYDPSASLSEGKNKMLQFATYFLGEKGPRIDYKLYAKNGGVALSYLLILRSCMSFALAGVDKETLAFGVVESMAEFYGNLLRDMGENFMLQEVILSGSMLSYRPFLNALVRYIPSLKIHISPDFSLDHIKVF
ncbi:hypothetical protein CCZ01_00350 [Helicobacter monodelphidis]|uniref:hypothetical protein n=1 Tax=Helicobacter sp. 15-1451 TaxID=2004995 RepID=UPI000DCCB4FD|nr:hypothetical protein [Helicobacter sp. 15-1451]RAX59230.1 hypothetical protein CCZ01_00350 [Helicobacter sp. 15-1451]